MTRPTLRETFYGPGVTAQLIGYGRRSLLEVWADPAGERFATQLDCEVLMQPHDERGVPTGPVATLARQRLRLAPIPDHVPWVARWWLPWGIQPALARDCYYRLTPA